MPDEQTPFEEAIKAIGTEPGSERDKRIWNRALQWAAQNVHMETVDEQTCLVIDEIVERMEFMDEVYQVSQSSILRGLERI